MTSSKKFLKRSLKLISKSSVASLLVAAILSIQSFGVIQPEGLFAQSPSVQPADGSATTEINLKNAEIASIIRIFSKKTGRNFILDENVKGKITIYLPGKVSEDEAFRVLESILALKGFTSVPVGDNLWKIIPTKDAKQSTIPLRIGQSGDKPSAAVVTKILALKYTNADDVKQLITPLISNEGLVNAYLGTNSLIIIDSEDNIERVSGIIGEIDVPSTDRDMTIIPIDNAEAKEIAEKLNEILGNPGQQGGNGAGGEDAADLLRNRAPVEQANITQVKGAPAAGGAPIIGAVGGKTVSARTRNPKITADERTNSIIVIADEETTARIRGLISQLDSKMDLSGSRFFVYRCQHASAEELVDVLNGLGNGGAGGGGAARQNNNNQGQRDLFGGDNILAGQNRNNNRENGRNRMDRQQRTPGRSRNEGRQQAGAANANIGEDISISADPSTNSLIIFASKGDYERILGLIKELDIKRRQVLVEAMLLEVAMDDIERTGLSFLGSIGGADGGMLVSNGGGDIINLLQNPSAIQDFAAAAASSGTLSLGSSVTIPTQSVLLAAAKNNSSVNVLSSPTILTTDNEEAEIVVGQNVPFLASTSTSGDNLNNTFNQIDRQDVGITLRLTPQISSGEYVNLKIFTEVSSIVGDSITSQLGPTTTIRTSETTVITKDSQMVAIGGLIAEDMNQTSNGIPFLKDVPVLGHFFGQDGERLRKNNLLIFITPRIIKDQYDHRDITIERRDELERTMAQYGSLPRREEVLHNKHIDHVAENSQWEGDKPSTILPPVEDKTSPSNLRSNSLGNDQSTDIKEFGNIEEFGSQETKAKLSPAIKEKEISKSGGRFIVLEKTATRSDSFKAPFLTTGKRLVAIALPEESSKTTLSFFEAGKRYEYGGEITLRVLGVYNSPEEATSMHQGIPEQWHELSPYEIMNLGTAPWRNVTLPAVGVK